MKDYVQIYQRKLARPTQRWRWRRVSLNGKILSQSSEGYRDQSTCIQMAVRCNVTAQHELSWMVDGRDVSIEHVINTFYRGGK